MAHNFKLSITFSFRVAATPIEGPTEGSARKHSPKDEKANEADGDVVMEDNKDGGFYPPRTS